MQRNPSAVQRIPAVMNLDVVPNKGRMNRRWHLGRKSCRRQTADDAIPCIKRPRSRGLCRRVTFVPAISTILFGHLFSALSPTAPDALKACRPDGVPASPRNTDSEDSSYWQPWNSLVTAHECSRPGRAGAGRENMKSPCDSPHSSPPLASFRESCESDPACRAAAHSSYQYAPDKKEGTGELPCDHRIAQDDGAPRTAEEIARARAKLTAQFFEAKIADLE
jgi:hypothetical protein